MRRTIFSIAIAIVVFVAGFSFLLRGCLSKYDERSALLPVLYFEKNDTPVIFSIVMYSKATSYSQRGSFIQKTVSSDYFIQSNDGNNGAELKNKKIKNHSDIKNYPVEILGASRNKAWLFMDGLMAFDPFTLEPVADTRLLEQKNPSLTNKFPAERRYYAFNRADSCIYFTATDGTKWKLSTDDLSILPGEPGKDSTELALKKMEQLENQNQAEQDSNYRRSNTASALSAEGKINRETYSKTVTAYYTVREKLYKERDSLDRLKNEIRKTIQVKKARLQLIESMLRVNPGYAGIKANADSANNKWYGLYSDTEFDKLYDRFQYNSENDETARRKLFSTAFIRSSPGDPLINKTGAVVIPGEPFLHGGFLIDKKTGLPLHYNNGWLIVSKEQIGREGKMIVSSVSYSGKINWSFNTQLHDWLDWIYAANHLYVFGNDNPKLSSNECNVLWCIDLASGSTHRFDYFNPPRH